jgi:phage terminase small subunit
MLVKKKQSKPRTKLTIKQEKFVNEVVKSGNATQAVKNVYKKTTEWSARAIGSENLTKPNIKKAIDDRLQVAKDMIYVIATTAEKDDTKLRACQDIVDRGEWKATQRIIQESKVEIDIKNATPEELLAFIKK